MESREPLARLEDLFSLFRDIASNVVGADEHPFAPKGKSWTCDGGVAIFSCSDYSRRCEK